MNSLENLMWGIFLMLVIVAGICLVLAAADWIVGWACRVFPRLADWLDSLPLSR